MDSSTRSMTATTGRTVLAIVAILSLLLSAFAIARPVIASHDVAGPAVPATFQEGNPSCPAGTTEIKFEPVTDGSKSVDIIVDGQTVTVTATLSNVGNGMIDFSVDDGLAMYVIVKGGPNANIYDYRPTGTAHDDRLVTPTNPNNNSPYGLSHVSICVVPIVASVDVTKTGPDLSKVTDGTAYTVSITNDGNVALYLLTIDDTLQGDLKDAANVDSSTCGATLAVDATCTIEYTYVVQEGDDDPLLNTVSVTANTAADGSGASASDTASASVNLFQPGIDVTKVADVETALVGDTVTYTVRITNTSSADSPDLDLTAIDDSLEGDMLAECPDLLATGDFCEFTYSHLVTTGDADPLVNTISVESNPVGFTNDIDDTATETVDVLMPSVDVEKDGPDLSKATDPAVYTVTITNDGETVIYIESIEDSLQGDLTDAANVDSTDCGASLAIDASCEITYTYIVAEDDLDPLENTVTVVANTAADFAGVEVDDTDTFSVELFQPDIEVTKVGDVTEAAVGDDVTYTVTIENTSSLDSPDLDFDAISDSLQGDLTDAANYDTSDCGATLAAGDSCTIVYTRTVLETDVSPLVNTVNVESHPEGFPNDIDDSDEFSVVIEEEAEEGSITIDKELEECETCEAYTPGYWFNRGGGGGVDWANEWLAANPQVIAGVGTFDSVGSVQAYLDADTAGDDGAKGLSATGQLLRHYLALVLNVAFAEANDCDLASLTYGEGTIADWLDAALTALESDASDDDKREIKDALDAINNSDAGDGTLECDDSEAGPHAGVMFELYDAEDQLVDSGSTGVDGSLLLDGDPDGSGLPLGTYTLVEVSNDADLECSIVSVSGDGATLNEDGTVTIVLAEGTADVTIIVVNDCEEQPGEEDEFGHISVVKETDEAVATESFSFTATWDADGFTLMDGDLEPSGDLLAGADYTVTEVLSPAQVAAGWSLDDIECTGAATWSVSGDGMSVTITLGVDEDVVCTFTNELEDQPGEGTLEIDKIFCVTSGEAETEFFVFEPTIPESMSTQNVLEDEQPDEGCWTQDVAFTITGGDLAEPVHVTTGDDGILEVDLPASENAYTITEDLSGESDEFWVEEGAVTVVLVINWIPEEIGNGTVKVIKLFCETDDAAEAGVTFQVEGADVAVPVLQGCTPGNATFEFGDDTFSVGSDGLAIFTADVGEYDFAETAPNAAVYSGTVPVVEDGYTTVIVFNTFVEGEQGGNPGTNPGGGVTPGQSQTPREGTAGGNPLPNTATTPAPGGSLPAIVLALMALGALAVGGQRMAAEARSRR